MALKAFLFAIAVTISLLAYPAAGSWGNAGFYPEAQAQPPGRGGGRFERREPPREPPRQQRPDDRRGQMTPDERRALHQDLDKANRELYRRRQQK